jgi:putative transcriptional regulator
MTTKKFPAKPRQHLSAIVATNLIRLRDKAGLSQSDLADKLGVQQSTISGIECQHRNPSMKMLIDLAAALEVPPRELFREVKP